MESVFLRCRLPGHGAERLESIKLTVEKLSKVDKKFIEDATADLTYSFSSTDDNVESE
jgi:hypothetical protein